MPPQPDDQTYYTWSTFFSILTGTAPPTTRAAYFAARDTVTEAADIARCNADKAYLFKYSPIIRFLQHHIDQLGPADPSTTAPGTGPAAIGPHNVRCRRCLDGGQKAGFDPQFGIKVCANEVRGRGQLEDTLAHEMMHAYDFLRFKLDPLDLRHAACMEIRASMLSGECRFLREFVSRGQWGVTQQLQECVRRRAALSVRARPACGGDDVKAVRVVNEVWDSCFADTRPFDEIYR